MCDDVVGTCSWSAGMAGMREACRGYCVSAGGPDGEAGEGAVLVDGVAVGVQFLIGLVREGLGTARGGIPYAGEGGGGGGEMLDGEDESTVVVGKGPDMPEVVVHGAVAE